MKLKLISSMEIFSNKLKIDIFPACSMENSFAFYIYVLPINPGYLLEFKIMLYKILTMFDLNRIYLYWPKSYSKLYF